MESQANISLTYCSKKNSLSNYRSLYLIFSNDQVAEGGASGPPCTPLATAMRLARNLSDPTVASSQYDILFCSETLVSDMHHVSELLVPGFGRPVLLCRANVPRARGMAAYIRDGYRAFRQQKFECGCCEMLVFRVCGVRQNLYVYSLYRNTDLDDQIFHCLLASMAAVQAEDVRASFLFARDLNGHHQEWLGSMTTNRHGVAAFDFTTVSSCDQLVVGPWCNIWLSDNPVEV